MQGILGVVDYMITLEEFYSAVCALNEVTNKSRAAFTFFKSRISDRSLTTIHRVREEIRFNLCHYEKRDIEVRRINATVIQDLKNLWAYVNEELDFGKLLKKYVISGEIEDL